MSHKHDTQKVTELSDKATEAISAQDLPKIRRYISGRVANSHDVDDLVQETMLRTLRSANWQEINSPVAYTVKVAKSVLYDYWRGGSEAKNQSIEEQQTELVDPDSTVESKQINQAKLQAMSQIVAEMPKLRREVFIKRRLEGLSREDIAQQLGLSVEAVKKHINRAMLDLTEKMQKRGWNHER